MTIVDRETGVLVKAMRQSYHMFGETWYQHDYDVAGCPLRTGDRVVDVGVNQGFFTCYAARRGAQVFAFEPNPKAFQVLEKTLQSMVSLAACRPGVSPLQTLKERPS